MCIIIAPLWSVRLRFTGRGFPLRKWGGEGGQKSRPKGKKETPGGEGGWGGSRVQRKQQDLTAPSPAAAQKPGVLSVGTAVGSQVRLNPRLA